MDLASLYVNDIFYRLVTDSEARLRHGNKLREEMLQQIKKGELPKGYRPVWLRDSADLLLELMRDIAKEFNLEHPDDQCSNQDLLDILATTMNLIRKASHKKS